MAIFDSPDTTDMAKAGYIGDNNYKRDPNRRDWNSGYYVDALDKFQPLKGEDPVHLGDGGGTPAVLYKVEGKKDKPNPGD